MAINYRSGGPRVVQAWRAYKLHKETGAVDAKVNAPDFVAGYNAARADLLTPDPYYLLGTLALPYDADQSNSLEAYEMHSGQQTLEYVISLLEDTNQS